MKLDTLLFDIYSLFPSDTKFHPRSVIHENTHSNLIQNVTSFKTTMGQNYLGKFSLHPSEIESRLRDVTVFALVYKNSAFFTACGQINDICPFFMDKLTAEKYHDKIFRDNQDMAKNARIMA